MGILGSSPLAPVLYGRLGDAAGLVSATIAAAVTALAVVPLMLILSPRLIRMQITPREDMLPAIFLTSFRSIFRAKKSLSKVFQP